MSGSEGNGTDDASFNETLNNRQDLIERNLEFYNDCINEISNAANLTFKLTGTETPASTCFTLTKFKEDTSVSLDESIRSTIEVVYWFLIVAGFITNISVCWVIIRNSQARVPRNLFVVNLSVSDITVCAITMPCTMLRLLELPSWNYSETLCRLTSLFEGVNVLVSSGTVTAIAGDRLYLVLRKTVSRADKNERAIASVIGFIWFVSVLVILPTFFFTSKISIYLPGTRLVISEVCTENWPHPAIPIVYSLCFLVVQYIIPICVILITHLKIIQIIQKRSSLMFAMDGIRTNKAPTNEPNNLDQGGNNNNYNPTVAGGAGGGGTTVGLANTPLVNRGVVKRAMTRAELTIQKNRKTTSILMIIAMVFGITWLPYHVFIIVMEIQRAEWIPVLITPNSENILFFAVHAFAMSSAVANPILYGWLNTNLRHFFLALLPDVINERNDDEGSTPDLHGPRHSKISRIHSMSSRMNRMLQRRHRRKLDGEVTESIGGRDRRDTHDCVVRLTPTTMMVGMDENGSLLNEDDSNSGKSSIKSIKNANTIGAGPL